jgi:hypothetical protein
LIGVLEQDRPVIDESYRLQGVRPGHGNHLEFIFKGPDGTVFHVPAIGGDSIVKNYGFVETQMVHYFTVGTFIPLPLVLSGGLSASLFFFCRLWYVPDPGLHPFTPPSSIHSGSVPCITFLLDPPTPVF